jgi:ClpX C4-type zinc finger
MAKGSTAARARQNVKATENDTGESGEEVVACCTFCLRRNTEVRALVAGPAVFICDGCVDLCCQIIGGLPKDRACASEPRRLLPWVQADSLHLALANLPNVENARLQVEESLVGWVERARELGATWSQIGGALGMTRQSAWERFAPDD